MISILELEIFHCHTEHISGAHSIRQGGHACHVVPSHMMLLLLPESVTGVLQIAGLRKRPEAYGLIKTYPLLAHLMQAGEKT
jgi:hypothetical protein